MIEKLPLTLLLCTSLIWSEGPNADPAPSAEAAASQQDAVSAIDRRIVLESNTLNNPFVLTPHRPTYMLPATYTSKPNPTPFEPYDQQVTNWEIKGQISVKMQLERELFGDNGYLYLAYTQKAHWQAYNSRDSAPFRDTNHEPELFITFLTNQRILWLKNRLISFGINHQSNGRSGSLSRSWNRLFADFVFERGNFYLDIKPWWR
ncbi:MAG: phospholipase A, partial [Gammaproteobacteria bacterium]|nr:phospholipase A [Gammaproteobacteria bacterium]